MFFIFFYSSNLRAFLINKSYEKPIRTIKDVVDSDQNIWIPESFSTLR